MGIFSSFFKKAGNWHIKQLVKDCCDQIIKATMQAYNQKENPYLVDYALNILIDHGSFNIVKEKEYSTLKEKLRDYMSFYVVRNLGRDIDWLSGENEIMIEEIEKYWPVFKQSKDETIQLIDRN